MASQSAQPQVSNPASQELTNSDLALLLNVLNSVAPKCFALGLQLGLKYYQIRQIEYNTRRCEDQLREILSERLRHNSPLTWHDIVRALNADSVSENRLASEIENKYIHHLPPPDSVAIQAKGFSHATSPLTSSHESSFPASQCDNSPLAFSSGNRYDQVEMNAPQPQSSISQQEIAGSFTHNSADHTTHNIVSLSQHSLHTARTDLAQTPTSSLHVAHPRLTNQFLPNPLMQPHMPIRVPVYHPPMTSAHYLTPYPHQLHSVPASSVPLPLRAEPLDVLPCANDRPSQEDSNTPYPSYMHLPYHSPLHQLHQTPNPTPPYIPYPTISHMSLPTPNRLHEEAHGTGWNSRLLISYSTPQLTQTQTYQPSGSSSLESRCCPSKRPCLEATLDPCSQLHTQNTSSGSESTENMCTGHHSEMYFNVKHPPQSVKRKPGKEHYHSERRSTTEPHITPEQHSQTSCRSGYSVVRSPIDLFIDYIKDTYTKSVIENNSYVVKWPPTPSKVFINLACIDRSTVFTNEEVDEYTRAMVEDGNIDVILKNKDCGIDFDHIAQGLPQTRSSRNVIIVEGAPGVGKSTFAWEFCRRWERGEIAQQYQLVLLLRLRDDRISKATSLEDLVYHPQQAVCHEVCGELLSNGGITTLIILEGFDELPDDQRKESSVFLQLILGKLLLHATILVTSRHWATSAVMRMINHRVFQHIEVLGFTEKSIKTYIISVFTGKEVETHSVEEGADEVGEEAEKNISDVIKYLRTYPQIKACTYIPLNAAIVVSIHQESKKGKCLLPKTLTELYYALTQVLLLRYLYGHPVHSQREWNIDSFENDLPSEVYTQLLSISNIAYAGICTKWGNSVQLIFSYLPAGFETLGFMQSVSQLYVKHGQKMSHNFLHLTVQEFLAALHIKIAMTPAKQLKHFQMHEVGRLKVVLRFLAGLTKLSTITHEQLRGLLGKPPMNIEQEKRQSSDCKPMKPDVYVNAHNTNWLFEVQNPNLVQSLLHNSTVAFTFTRDMLQLEYYSVGYCIAHSHCNCILLKLKDDDEEKIKMIVSGMGTRYIHQGRISLNITIPLSNENLSLLWKCFSGCIEELYLTVPNSLSLPNLSELRILKLTMNVASAINIPSLPCLESLTIVGDAQMAVNVPNSLSLPNLSELRILKLTMNVVSAINIISLPCLESLTIVGDAQMAVNVKSGKAISKLLASLSSLKEFCVKGNMRDKPMDVIAKGVRDSVALHLKRLEIYGHKTYTCSLSTTASRSLAQFITKTTKLQNFRTCNAKISGQGLIALIAALHNCPDLCEKMIKKLSLVFDDKWSTASTEEVRTNFTRLFNDHPDMVDIEESLRDLSATEEKTIKASIIALSCDYCLCITLNNNSISDAGAVTLAWILHHNSTLEKLDLSNNSICDAGAVALAQTLHHNSTLKQLNLSSNSITDTGAVALVQALYHNSTLEDLNLSNNSNSDAGALALAQSPHHNSTLKKLDLHVPQTGAITLSSFSGSTSQAMRSFLSFGKARLGTRLQLH